MAKIKDISKTPIILRADLAEVIENEYGAEIEEHGLTYVAHVILIGYFNRRRAQMKLSPLPPAQTKSEMMKQSAIKRWEAVREAKEEAEAKKEARRAKRKAAQSASAPVADETELRCDPLDFL